MTFDVVGNLRLSMTFDVVATNGRADGRPAQLGKTGRRSLRVGQVLALGWERSCEYTVFNREPAQN